MSVYKLSKERSKVLHVILLLEMLLFNNVDAQLQLVPEVRCSCRETQTDR